MCASGNYASSTVKSDQSCALHGCEQTSTFNESTGTKGASVTQAFKQYKLQNPLDVKSIPALIGRVVTIFIGLVGSFALLMFVYGSFLWLTSRGNAEQVQKGKNVFVWAVIGLVIIFGAYVILRTVFKTIGATS